MKFIRKFPVADADSLESPQKFEGFFLDYYPRVKGFINGLLQDAEEELNAKELELIIAIAVERMPSQRRKIYQMSREQGLSNENIARELNISKRTVENHLTQALADIRKILFWVIMATFV